MADTTRNNNNFSLINDLKDVAADVFSIRDDIGAKKANVYFYRKKGDDRPIWTQMLPSPKIRISNPVQQTEGGVEQAGDLILSGIPISLYKESDLETATFEGDTELYWVIDGKAYTTTFIERKYLSYNIHISRYRSINQDDILPPQEFFNKLAETENVKDVSWVFSNNNHTDMYQGSFFNNLLIFDFSTNKGCELLRKNKEFILNYQLLFAYPDSNQFVPTGEVGFVFCDNEHNPLSDFINNPDFDSVELLLINWTTKEYLIFSRNEIETGSNLNFHCILYNEIKDTSVYKINTNIEDFKNGLISSELFIVFTTNAQQVIDMVK